MTKKAALYSRVSTSDQTTESQRHGLKKYCEARRLDIIDIYEDRGISGSQDSRPGLDALMADARKRTFDMVIVYKFDTFASSTQHLLSALQEFRELGIDFISCSEGIDTSTSTGKMIFTFLAALSEFER